MPLIDLFRSEKLDADELALLVDIENQLGLHVNLNAGKISGANHPFGAEEPFRQQAPSLPINVLSMTDVQNGHLARRILDLVDNPVISDTDAPAFPSGEFPAAGRPRRPS
jgi:hypothetical protein